MIILGYGFLAVGLVLAGTGFVFIYSKLNAQQRQELDRLAAQAVSFVEQKAKNSNLEVAGEEKLSNAIDFVANKVNSKFHTKFTPEEIEAACQYAFDKSPLKKDVANLVKRVETR